MMLTRAKQRLGELMEFVRQVAVDPRIPERDKAVVLALLALIISPIDLVPDWIPIFGVMDDFVLMAVVLDYFFNVLGDEILLSHWPWGMKSFAVTRRMARMIAAITPEWARKRIWKFEGSPYRRG